MRDEINKFKVGAPARVGLVAPNDVVAPLGNTGLDPSQTSFFQACAWARVLGLMVQTLHRPPAGGVVCSRQVSRRRAC